MVEQLVTKKDRTPMPSSAQLGQSHMCLCLGVLTNVRAVCLYWMEG